MILLTSRHRIATAWVYGRRMETLIAEDVLLLMLDEEKGTLTGSGAMQPVLGGALLIELAITGAVVVEEKTSLWKPALVSTVPGARPDEPVLAAAYDVIAAKPRTAQDLVNRIGKGQRKQLLERMVERGIVERRDAKVLGVFPTRRWPVADAARRRHLRQALTAALVQGFQPDDRTSALVAVIYAISQTHRVVDNDGQPASAVKKRAKALSEGAWAAKAISDSISAAASGAA